MTSAPLWKSSSMTREMVVSLPGMAEAEIMMRSPASMFICLCSEKAMR